MANNSIGAYAQGGSNDIGAYENAAAGGGLTVDMSLATISIAKQNKTVFTDRTVSQTAVAAIGIAPYGGVVGYPRAVEVDLATMSITPSSMPLEFDRKVDMDTATVGISKLNMTIALTLRRIVNMTLATLSTTKYRLGTMYDLGERRVRKTLALTAKLTRLLVRNITNGT
jgi:hypothetical protein